MPLTAFALRAADVRTGAQARSVDWAPKPASGGSDSRPRCAQRGRWIGTLVGTGIGAYAGFSIDGALGGEGAGRYLFGNVGGFIAGALIGGWVGEAAGIRVACRRSAAAERPRAVR